MGCTHGGGGGGGSGRDRCRQCGHKRRDGAPTGPAGSAAGMQHAQLHTRCCYRPLLRPSHRCGCCLVLRQAVPPHSPEELVVDECEAIAKDAEHPSPHPPPPHRVQLQGQVTEGQQLWACQQLWEGRQRWAGRQRWTCSRRRQAACCRLAWVSPSLCSYPTNQVSSWRSTRGAPTLQKSGRGTQTAVCVAGAARHPSSFMPAQILLRRFTSPPACLPAHLSAISKKVQLACRKIRHLRQRAGERRRYQSPRKAPKS